MTMLINSISDFRRAMRIGPYAWPGGYPLYFVMSDGGPISFESARKERRRIMEALAEHDNSGWRPVAFEINYEDTELFCAHSGEMIESAYGGDS